MTGLTSVLLGAYGVKKILTTEVTDEHGGPNGGDLRCVIKSRCFRFPCGRWLTSRFDARTFPTFFPGS